ncbi:MAG: hypothetical protein ACRDQ5_22405 [Sciscionella sp.]
MRGTADRVEVGLLMLDAAILAVLELFFLPLRFDGRALPDWGAWPAPVTVLVAIVTMPLLVRRAGRLSPKLSVAGAPLFSWLVVIGVLCFAGPGGDIMLLPDWRSLLLVGGGAVAAAMQLGRILAAEMTAGIRGTRG